MKKEGILRRFTTSWMVFLIVILTLNSKVNANVLAYFPIYKGNWWTYSNENGEEITRVVTRASNTIVITAYKDKTPISAAAYGVYQNRIDIIETYNENGNTTQWTPPMPFLIPQYEKEQWGYIYQINETGKLVRSFPVYTLYERFDFEEITINGNPLKAQYIRLTLKSRIFDEVRDIWFAPNIGIVRERVKIINHLDQQTSEELWELTRYGVRTPNTVELQTQ